MAGGDAIVSNCFVSHLFRAREPSSRRSGLVRERPTWTWLLRERGPLRGPLEMCLVSACTLRRQLNLSTVARPAPPFHYFLEDTLPDDLVAPFRAVADSVELLPPFEWPGRPLASTQRDRLYSFNKLRVWTLTRFDRVLYFDPDVFWTGDPARYLSRFGHAPHLAAAEYHGSSVPPNPNANPNPNAYPHPNPNPNPHPNPSPNQARACRAGGRSGSCATSTRASC